MDSPGYRIAISDRAFAFDGAYRLATTLSLADRAAYGLRRYEAHNLVGGFAVVLQAAAKAERISTTPTVRLGKRCLPYYKSCSASRPAPRKPVELPNNTRRPFATEVGKRCLPHYKASRTPVLTVSCATVRASIGDVTIHAVAMRGRVFIGVRGNA